MVRYTYVAVDREGREVRGSLEAAEERTAAIALRERSLMVMHLEVRSGGSPAGLADAPVRRRPGWVRERERIFFLRQMALMLRSGLTLLTALQTCARQIRRRRLAECLERVAGSIQSGERLSRALAAEPGQFPTLTVKLVESAEVSGEMAGTFEQIAEQRERSMLVRRNLLGSLLYPAIVMAVSVAVAVFLVLEVIPRFASFFAGRNVPLPPMTRALMHVAAWFQNYGLVLLFVLAIGLLGLVLAWITPRGKLAIDRVLLRVPVVGKLLSTAAMARMAHTLSALVTSGVTLLESLRTTSGVVGNRAVAHCLESASERILEGRDLAGSLRARSIPPLVPQVVGVGERSGALTSALDDLGRFYERELDSGLRRMSSIIEPLLLLIVGGMVGFVYISFFQAVFSLVN